MSGVTTNGAIPPWEPDELGVPQASLASFVLVGLIVGGIIYAGTHLPKPPKPVIPVTEVHMVTLPKPPPPKPLPKPPPPPPPIPVPKPIPHPIIHHPVPVKTKIPVPAVKHIVIHKPPPKKPPPPPPPVPQPPPQPAFNAAAYGAAQRASIERLVPISRAMQMLHIQGTTVVEFEVLPSGRLVFVKVYKSSGNPLIDQSALAGVQRNRYPSFPGTQPKMFIVPIEILPESSQD